MSDMSDLPDDNKIDEEFREITRHLHDLDHSLPPRGSGPRDWVAISPDEAFDPSDLTSPNEPEQSHPLLVKALGGCALLLLIVTILGSAHILPLATPAIGIAGVLAFALFAVTAFLYSPRTRDSDDDGARL